MKYDIMKWVKKMDCLFCKIVNKEIESFILYEDELVICFLDAFPDSNGHTLIIPKEHYQDFDDINRDVLIHITDVAHDIKKLLEDKLHCTGISLMQNNGSCQEIKHFHLHLKPYYKEKQQKMTVSDVYKKISQ